MSERRVAVVTGGTAGIGRATVRELAAHGWDVAVLARGEAGLDGAVADVEAAGGRGLGISTDVADLDQVRAAADRTEKELGPIDLWVNNAFSGNLRYFWDTPPEVQLPGVNTVQFDWNADEFDQHPQPVAPIFQPELPARAVRFLADHPRRTLWVGYSTAYTILGNRVAPWFLDWYLARTGVRGQLSQDGGPRHGSNVETARDDTADRGAHGMFDDQATSHDPWSWASMHRTALAAAAATVTAGLMASRLLRRR